MPPHAPRCIVVWTSPRTAHPYMHMYKTKTISACPTRYSFRHQKAVESRSTGIKSEHVRKVKEIDRTFTPDIVGDSDDTVGPFQNAYRHMYNTFCRAGH